MKEGKEISYTWGDYFNNAFNFSKAITKMGTEERAAVAVMGFNAPEWMFAFVGGILNNQVSTGMYGTNSPEACLYQMTHSETQVLVCETNEHLKKVACNLDKMP